MFLWQYFWQILNRCIFPFNEPFSKYREKYVLSIYKKILSELLRRCVSAIIAWIGVLKLEEEFPTPRNIYCAFYEKASHSEVMGLPRGWSLHPIQNRVPPCLEVYLILATLSFGDTTFVVFRPIISTRGLCMCIQKELHRCLLRRIRIQELRRVYQFSSYCLKKWNWRQNGKLFRFSNKIRH